MRKRISKVCLFTNRNVLIFDEDGNQVPKLQMYLRWDTSKHRGKEMEVISRIIEDRPKIYLTRWREWSMPITLEEFVDLMGYGPEFRKYINQPICTKGSEM